MIEPNKPDVSPTVSLLLDSLAEVLPDSERPRLGAYEAKLDDTLGTPEVEHRRALICAEWALELASSEAHGLKHLLAELSEAAHQMSETVKAFDVGMSGLGVDHVASGVKFRVAGASPRAAVDASHVDDAVRVASEVAAKSGWEEVPFEQLLDELFAAGSDKS